MSQVIVIKPFFPSVVVLVSKKICAEVPSVLRIVWNVLQRINSQKRIKMSVKYVERISLAFRHVANSFIVYFLWDLQEVDRYRTAMRKMTADLSHVRENCKRLEVIRF